MSLHEVKLTIPQEITAEVLTWTDNPTQKLHLKTTCLLASVCPQAFPCLFCSHTNSPEPLATDLKQAGYTLEKIIRLPQTRGATAIFQNHGSPPIRATYQNKEITLAAL